MRAYKVHTYEQMERTIDVYCMIFGVLFCLAYFTILCSGISCHSPMKLYKYNGVIGACPYKKWVWPSGPLNPFFVGVPTTSLFTILRREGTCAAFDAPGEVPTAMDADLVEVFPRHTCFRFVTEYAKQCSSPSSTSHHAWLDGEAWRPCWPWSGW